MYLLIYTLYIIRHIHYTANVVLWGNCYLIYLIYIIYVINITMKLFISKLSEQYLFQN
ncbi:hypothetical protein COTS27_01153 [Spirochaetota bacterium]|nr:hypothetical protein COTS27_01153 [Spirochaetota bacterium]